MARAIVSPKKTVIFILLLLALLSVALPAWCATTNVANGGLYHSQKLLAAKGTPLALDMSLYYSSMYAYKGPLGQGWTHSYDLSLTDGGNGSKVLHDGDNVRLYLANGTGYTSQSGDTSVLTTNATGFLVSYRDGRKEYFGADGKITSLVDRYNNAISFDNSNNARTVIADPAGHSITIEYDTTTTPPRITSICPPGVATTDAPTKKYTFEYDPATGLLAKVTNPLADETVTVRGFWQYTYEDGRLKTLLDPNGKLFTYNYYPDGRMKSSVDPEGLPDANGVATVTGHTRTLVYNNEEGTIKTTTFTEKDGGVWTYVYDTHAGVLKQKIAPDPATGAPSGKATSYAYYLDEARKGEPGYPYGSLKAKSEPHDGAKRLTTFYWYDIYGNVTNETEPLDLSLSQYAGIDPETVDTVTFGGVNSPVKWAFSYIYDTYGRLLRKTDLRGATQIVTCYDYDTVTEPGVEILKVTDPENKVLTYRYNTVGGALMSVIDANNVSVTYDYYANGLPLSIKDQHGVVTKFTIYDNTGNIRETQQFDKNGLLKLTTVYDYDALSHLRKIKKTTTDTPSIVTEAKYDYDLMGNLTVYTDPEDQPTIKQTKYDYNYNRQVTKITDPYDNKTYFTYSGSGCGSCGGGVDKLIEVLDAKHKANNWPGTTYQYDKLGRLERETDPRGKTVRYIYYDNGLVKEKIDASATPEKTLVSYEYNNRGQVTKKRVLDGSGTGMNETTFGYDDNGNLQTALNGSITYTLVWYKNGQLKSIADNLNRTVAYQYDGAGYRTVMTGPDGFPYQYGTDGGNNYDWWYTPMGIFSATYNDQGLLGSLTTGFLTTYGYDGLGRLTQLTSTSGTGQTLASYGYTYYRNDNRQTRTEPTFALTYTYDNLLRLKTVTDNLGATVESYSYDEVGNRDGGTYLAGNQLDNYLGVAHTYDDHGNLKTKNDGVFLYTYIHDGENRLTRVDKKTISTGAVISYSYLYDPFGRRIGKGNTRYVYDGDNILYEYNSSNVLQKRYVNGPGIDNALAYADHYDISYYYVKDGLGSVTKRYVPLSGRIFSFNYDSFGKFKLSRGDTLAHAFTGRQYDEETGLYYYRARYYDPMVGRFISRDPLGFKGGINLYNYVQNNPINWVDPTGLTAACPASPPRGDSGWVPYYGNPNIFHCGFDGYLENRKPKPDDPIGECFYDKGKLVDDNHPFPGCKGTPDQYGKDNPLSHTFRDSGGIVQCGLPAAIDSLKYYFSDKLNKLESDILRTISGGRTR